MTPIIVAVGVAAAAAVSYAGYRLTHKAAAIAPPLNKPAKRGVAEIPNPRIGNLPGVHNPSDTTMVDPIRITLPNGETWEVSPEYVGPVGIGEAQVIAKRLGLQLPTSELVDAIWNLADVKIEPPIRSHDGTPKTMSSDAVFENQRQRIVELIGGQEYKLLDGTHKNVIQLSNGKPGLYGWNVAVDKAAQFTARTGVSTHAVRGASGVLVKAGRVIQQEFGGHGLAWKDYSQGLRLVRKVG